MLNRFANLTVAVALPALLALALTSPVRVPAQTGDEVKPSDTAAFYKSKCFACHGPKAEKRFDPAVPEEQMVEAILKGKKAEKPPNMPSYEPKGVAADDAKALIAYMKQLKASGD